MGRAGEPAEVANVALFLASDLSSYLVGHPIVPPIMLGIYRSAWLPLLLLALVVLAPLGEEVLIRGFLYTGVASSRWGPGTAIVLSAIVWAAMHLQQYDAHDILFIVLAGLYLGFVRFKTASLPLTMLLHSIANAAATAELLIQEHWLK